MASIQNISNRHPELVSGSNQMLIQACAERSRSVQHDKCLCASLTLSLPLCNKPVCASRNIGTGSA